MESPFDAKAAQWDDNPVRLALARNAAEAITRLAARTDGADGAPPPRALEFGCGTGTLALLLRERLALGEAVLCDASAGMLEVARGKIEAAGLTGFTLLQSDFKDGPLPEGRFDLIYTAMALHHVEDVDGLLRRFAGLLAPGGRLVLIDLAKEDGSFHQGETVPHNGFDGEALAGQVHAAGLVPDAPVTLDVVERPDRPRAYPRLLVSARRLDN